jgi:MtN3 and saliva related transmembrane protein
MRPTTTDVIRELEHEANTALDRCIYFAALMGPFTALPQIYAIWFVDTSAIGVSLITWVLFLVMSIVWLAYGIRRRDRPTIISNALWCVMEIVIIAGAARFNHHWL